MSVLTHVNHLCSEFLTTLWWGLRNARLSISFRMWSFNAELTSFSPSSFLFLGIHSSSSSFTSNGTVCPLLMQKLCKIEHAQIVRVFIAMLHLRGRLRMGNFATILPNAHSILILNLLMRWLHALFAGSSACGPWNGVIKCSSL